MEGKLSAFGKKIQNPPHTMKPKTGESMERKIRDRGEMRERREEYFLLHHLLPKTFFIP
jgi:hypothetical protein